MRTENIQINEFKVMFVLIFQSLKKSNWFKNLPNQKIYYILQFYITLNLLSLADQSTRTPALNPNIKLSINVDKLSSLSHVLHSKVLSAGLNPNMSVRSGTPSPPPVCVDWFAAGMCGCGWTASPPSDSREILIPTVGVRQRADPPPRLS